MSEPPVALECARCGLPCPNCERVAREAQGRARLDRFAEGYAAMADAARDPRALSDALERATDERLARFDRPPPGER